MPSMPLPIRFVAVSLPATSSRRSMFSGLPFAQPIAFVLRPRERADDVIARYRAPPPNHRPEIGIELP